MDTAKDIDDRSPLTPFELRALLQISIAQMDAATKEAGVAVGALSTALGIIAKKPDDPEALQVAMTHAQFFDKFAQRLAHVREGLEILAAEQPAAPGLHSAAWPRVKQAIRDRYTTADECVLFDLYFLGLGKDVLGNALRQLRDAANSGDLDLF